MVSLPPPITDAFERASFIVQGPRDNSLAGFTAGVLPSQSGLSTRQATIPNERDAYLVRNIVHWFVPEVGVVDMYINPQSIDYQFKKHITNQRTKGGYVLQYWGEELTQLNIQGTTGSSGVEGINVLHDVYRAEQLAFDPFALALASDRSKENQNESFDPSLIGQNLTDTLGELGEDLLDLTANAAQTGSVNSTRAKPTLGSLAFSVEMYWSGWVFRGYFTNFTIQERADKLGLFDYSMTFMVTQRRGIRQNFLGWHRSAVSGPSNSDPEFGVPHTFNAVAGEQTRIVRQNTDDGRSVFDLLSEGTPLVSSGSSNISSIF